MARWFRFYDESINDPKVLRLSDELYRAWTILLCLTSKNGGNLPQAEDIALTLRMKVSKVCEWLTKLHASGLLDKTETGFQPHNWNGRQYKSDVSTDRVKRFRNGKRNVSETVSETAPDTEADTEAEKKKETRASALAAGWPPDFREQFWGRYPNKVGKPKALAKLELAMKRGVQWPAIIGGLDRYIRDKPPDRPWLNPETFINQERWADQPADTSNGHAATQNRPGSLIAAIDRQLARLEAEEGTPSADFALPANDIRRIPHGSISRS